MKHIAAFLIAGTLAMVPLISTTERAYAVYDDSILQFFEYDHLPEHLQETSFNFYQLAHWMDDNLPHNSQNYQGLQDLLKAKDAAIRAKIQTPAEPPVDEDPDEPGDGDGDVTNYPGIEHPAIGNDGRGFTNR